MSFSKYYLWNQSCADKLLDENFNLKSNHATRKHIFWKQLIYKIDNFTWKQPQVYPYVGINKLATKAFMKHSFSLECQVKPAK